MRPRPRLTLPPSAIMTILFWAVTLAFGFLYIVQPKAWDDYWFTLDIFYNAYDHNGFYNFWEGLKMGFIERYAYDNSRMCNTFAMFALLIPRWIPAGITMGVFAAAYSLLLKLVGIRKGQLKAFTLATLCLLFFPTWHDSFFALVYFFNYTWGMAIMFWAIHIFLSPAQIKPYKAILLGLLLGCWHESFAAAGFVGMAAVLIFKKDMRRRDRWIITVSVAIGSLWLVAFPAWTSRISRESGIFDTSLTHLLFSWGYYIFMAVWGICWTRSKWRPLAKSPIAIITAAGGFIVLPAVIASGNGRAASPAMMLACAGLPFLLTNMFPAFFNRHGRIGAVALTLIWALILSHLATACYYMAQLNRSHRILIDQIENHPRPDYTYFIPIVEEWQASPLALRKTPFRLFDLNDCNCPFIGHFYNCYTTRPVPDVLRDYKEGMGIPLEGNTESRLYKGFIVSPLRNYIFRGAAAAVMDYGWHKEFTQVFYAHFHGADGKPYVYIFARRSLLTTITRPQAKGIEIMSKHRPAQTSTEQ